MNERVAQGDNQVTRKYRMIRLSTGDYLFPGNDGETIFRVAKCAGGWACWRWPKPMVSLLPAYEYDDFEDWDRWYMIEDQFKKRQEAIDAALAWEWRRDNPVHTVARRPVDIGAVIASAVMRDSRPAAPSAPQPWRRAGVPKRPEADRGR